MDKVNIFFINHPYLLSNDISYILSYILLKILG